MTVDPARAARRLPRDELHAAWVWRQFIDEAHAPAEFMMALAMRRYLRGAAKRYSKRVRQVLGGRNTKAFVLRAELLEVDATNILVTVNEGERLRKVSRARVAQSVDAGFDFTEDRIGIRLSKSRLVEAEAKITQSLVTNVVGFTEKQIVNIINKGLREGASTAEIAGRIDRWTGFGPARAMRIARTEVTKATNTGALVAMDGAADAGRPVEGKRWLTQADGKVRSSHRAIQGQLRLLGQPFTSGAGNKAQAPGGFGIAREDLHCRCFVLPVVRRGRS